MNRAESADPVACLVAKIIVFHDLDLRADRGYEYSNDIKGTPANTRIGLYNTRQCTAAPQIGDGQIQAPTSTAAGAAQASDGQIQASAGANSTVASPSASPLAYTGAAVPIAIRGEYFGIAAAVMAVAML
ncbi:hypothetical protein LTS10_004325 [Elasticomyces elasticus]|nr:hypothetical protein LTS10_004325 [Elasticomyces elasticus]